MDAIFFNEQRDLGLDFFKIISDDFLIEENFEHYSNLIEDENVFLEPLLIAHFCQLNRKNSQSLNQLLLGYIKDEKQPHQIEVHSDGSGTIYLPNIGYLLTATSQQKMVLNIAMDTAVPERKYSLEFKGKNVPFEFEALRFVPNTNIEIFRHSHDYITYKLGHKIFLSNDVSGVTESTDWVDKYSEPLIKAFEIIEQVDPEQFAELKAMVKKIVFFEAEGCINFTSKDIQGILYISNFEEAKELIFMDTLVHECSHLVVNAILFDREAYFTVDSDKPMFRSPFRNELRSLYMSFHATYVLAKLIRLFNNLYQAKVFSGIEEYELLSLLILDTQLLGEAIGYIGDRSNYTDKGWKIMEEIQNVYDTVRNESKEVFDNYRLPKVEKNEVGTPINFKVDDFLKVNNLSRADLKLAG